MEEAPWWIVPLATFLSVVLAQGVVVVLFFTRQRGEDKRRWHDKRREVYANYARASFRVYRLYLSGNDGADIDQVQLADLLDEIDDLQLDVDLLSADPVKEKATVLQATLDLIRMYTVLDVSMPSAEDILLARLEFEEAVREELGVSRAPERVVITASGWGALGEVIKYAFRSTIANPLGAFSKRRIVIHRAGRGSARD